MKKISKMDIKQLCQSLESISDVELSEFIGGGAHYYVTPRGEIEDYLGDQYVGYYIYCGSDSLEIGGYLYHEQVYDGYNYATLIFNGTYEIFTFLVNHTRVEYGYFCDTDEEHPIEDSNGTIVTTGDENEVNKGDPTNAEHNTCVHSHPKGDGASGSAASDTDRETKHEIEENTKKSYKWYIYNPWDGQLHPY